MPAKTTISSAERIFAAGYDSLSQITAANLIGWQIEECRETAPVP